MNTGPVRRLLLLGRPDCHLCEEFAAQLHAAFPGRVELAHACVDDRDDWRERYGYSIPVLLAEDGAVILETFFNAPAMSAWLARASS